MRFSEVLGQDAIKGQLRGMADAGRLPHALLMLGPEGSGAMPIALAMAQYLVCENRQPHDACGQCSACLKAQKIIHSDIHFTFPTIGGKAISDDFLKEWRTALLENPYLNTFEWLQRIGGEGKQGNITARECNAIIKKLSLKTLQSKYKIHIIWMPEYLAKEGNRLLKIIEEPPQNAVFILVAQDQELIINTIISRCQLVKINALPDEVIAKSLESKLGLPEERAQSVAYLADGNFNEALSIAAINSSQKTEDRSEMFLGWLRKCYAGNGLDMSQWAETIAAIGRENQKFLLRYGLHFFREYLRLKFAGQTRLRLLPAEIKSAQGMTSVLDFEQVASISRLFDDCIFYIERNANPKILFLDTSIRLNKILKNR